LALCAVLALPAQAAPAKPQRILSMNQCTDLLLLQLVPKSRIAAVTYLARAGADSLFPGADRGLALNYGTPEDIIRYRPDLILAGEFSTPVTRRLAREVGAPIVEVKGASTVADIRASVLQVGAAVGEPGRARAIVARMDAQLAELAARPRRPVRVVAWDGGDSVPGRDTLPNRIIEAAGAVNIAAGPGRTYTTYDVERLLLARPDALISGGDARPLRQQDEARHRVLRRAYAGRRITYADVAWTCGLPQSVDSAVRLRRALDALPPRTAAP